MQIIKTKWITTAFISSMIIIFILNLIISRQYNIYWIAISGGGNITEYLQISSDSVFEKLQLYRLISYGFLQTAMIHLVVNVIALWYIGGFFEEYISRLKFVMIYIIGLVSSGIGLLLLYPNIQSYGASPAIYACIGVLIIWAQKQKNLWHFYKRKKGYRYMIGYFFLGNLLGKTTFVFHLLGLATGLLLGFAIKAEVKASDSDTN